VWFACLQLWQQSLGAIPTITRLQEKAETLRQEELNKASSKLSALSDRDLQVSWVVPLCVGTCAVWWY
jgi:glutamyl-tRNA reductase